MTNKKGISITVPASLQTVLLDLRVSHKFNFFIIGATARDILFEYHFKLPSQIATKDIDIAIVVKDWSVYETFKESLIQSGNFSPQRESQQRLIHKNSFPVDIIPYGAITDGEQRIYWPKTSQASTQSEMSVKGYLEASKHLINFLIKKNISVQVPNACAQFLLKILTWHESPDRKHDAQDLDFILLNYLQAGNFERLFEEHHDLIIEQFDTTVAGAELLGRDLKDICNEELRLLIAQILSLSIQPKSNYKLATSMIQTFDNLDEALESKLSLLQAVLRGVS